MTAASGPAGAIRVQLGLHAGQVAEVRLLSSRPTDLAQRLLAGRDVDAALAVVPLVFSVCATAQSQAAVTAIERAAGVAIDPRHGHARALLVLAETVREHLFRILLGWSEWLARPAPAAGLGALGRLRQAWSRALYPGDDAFRPGGGALAPDGRALATLADELDALVLAALGEPADTWLGRWAGAADADRLAAWAAAGRSPAQAMLQAVIAAGQGALGASPVGALPAIDDAAYDRLLDGAAADAFVATPEWEGEPRETGALQRRAGTPLVGALRRRYRNGLLVRLAARLDELAASVLQLRELVATLVPVGAGTLPPATGGSGVAQVEAARGRLVHRVQLVDGRVAGYRILAPTEWNFHPRGALVQGLQTLPADAQLPRLARLLVDAVDPCVESHVEVSGDA